MQLKSQIKKMKIAIATASMKTSIVSSSVRIFPMIDSARRGDGSHRLDCQRQSLHRIHADLHSLGNRLARGGPPQLSMDADHSVGSWRLDGLHHFTDSPDELLFARG